MVSEEIKQWVRDNSYFEVEDEEEDVNLLFATRENGNVGEEEIGEEDYTEAQRIEQYIVEKYPLCTVEVETVDEWVHINVTVNT